MGGSELPLQARLTSYTIIFADSRHDSGSAIAGLVDFLGNPLIRAQAPAWPHMIRRGEIPSQRRRRANGRKSATLKDKNEKLCLNG